MGFTHQKTDKKVYFYWLHAIGMFFYAGVSNLSAQSDAEADTHFNAKYRRENWKADLSLSSSGIGIGVGWKPFEMRWIFRAKYNYMAGGLDFGLPLNANNGKTDTRTSLHIHSDISMSHFDLLADYLIRWDENFKITMGLAYHPNKKISAEGSIRNFKFRDIVFLPSEIGTVKVELSSKYKLSPYLGMGFGRSIPKKRVRISGELGIYYLGNWQVDSVKIHKGVILDNWSPLKNLMLTNLINAHDAHKFLPHLNLMINFLLY